MNKGSPDNFHRKNRPINIVFTKKINSQNFTDIYFFLILEIDGITSRSRDHGLVSAGITQEVISLGCAMTI